MTDFAAFTHSIGDKWKYALLGGLASIPFTTASYWQSGSEFPVAPVFFGGLLAGYLATRRGGSSRVVGARAGLVGGLPVLWMLIDVLPFIVGLPNPAWFAVVSLAVAFGTAILGFGLTALFGEMGGRLGGWLSTRSGRSQPARASN